MRVRSFAAAVIGAVLALAPSSAGATAVWGDATLRSADRRVVIDKDGIAEVVEDVGIHVTSKHFRTFVVEGIEEGATAPTDPTTVAGMDGLGWPITVTDPKGNVSPAFAEPAKEPRQLRVRLGADGLPRGEFTVHLRYRVDFVRTHRIVRDGSALRLALGAPRWPEGYDNGKVTVVLPAAVGEPRLTVADVGEVEHAIDGLALVTVKREGAKDTLTIVRPHVPPHDDARWILRVDPQAFPALAAATGANDVDARPLGGTRARGRPVALAIGAGLLGLLLAFTLRARDRAVRALATRLELPPPRPLVSFLSDDVRAAAYGLTVGGAALATLLLPAPLAVPCIALSMSLAVLRPPRAPSARTAGRWLRVPRAPAPPLPPASFVDPSGLSGALAALVVIGGATLAAALLGGTHPRLALAVAMNVVVLAPLFVTGRRAQIAPCSTRGALELLAPLAARGQLVQRAGARGPADVRVRFEPSAEARTRGLVGIEAGAGTSEGFAGVELRLEILFRTEAGSAADRSLRALAEDLEVVRTLGRDPTESVTAVRLSSQAREGVFELLTRAEAAILGTEDATLPERRRTPRALVAPAVGFGPSHS